MLTFIIPVKSAAVAKHWSTTCKLFERCLRSTCNQSSTDFRTIVVCNEKPNIEFDHPQVDYILVDFVPPAKEKNPIARGLTDKGRKVLKGLIYAQQFFPSHAMIVDADDCVSARLAGFVKQYRDRNGWYFNTGFKYREGEPFIYIKRQNFYRMSGTSNILRFDLFNLPEVPEYNRGYGYYKFYVDHQKTKSIMAERGLPIQPLPFPGAIYILATGDNMSGNENNLSFNFFNRKRLTPEIRQEFSLDQ